MPTEVIVVRRARLEDAPARAEVLREAYLSLTTDAFFYFFFHETTLQGTVLAGAALFIFFGAGWAALGALPGVAAALALAGARLAHEAAAARHAGRLRRERAGWVAEARRGPARLVGTLSLAECRDAPGGWLHALGVRRAWRRRGVARALLAAAHAHAHAGGGHGQLHALASALQPAARALLHAAGWQPRDCYARPLLGATFALPLTRFHIDLSGPA